MRAAAIVWVIAHDAPEAAIHLLEDGVGQVAVNSFLITGAGSGIGKACAIYLAERGTRVFAAGRTMAKLEALSHDNIIPVQMDITDEASIHKARDQIKAHLNGAALTGLVNNAGISMMGPTALVSNEDWHRQFETNVFGAMNVIRAFLPEMIAARAGRIVTIGSVTGRLAPPFMGGVRCIKTCGGRFFRCVAARGRTFWGQGKCYTSRIRPHRLWRSGTSRIIALYGSSPIC